MAAPIGPAYRAQVAAMKSRRGWRWLTASLGAMALGTLVAAAMTSPALTVRAVKVVMAELPLEAETRCVRRRAALPPGVSLVLMDVRSYSDSLRLLPWVRSVHVRRSIDGTVTTEIEVRHPKVRLVCGGRRWEVDDDGVIVRPARRGVRLPEIEMKDPIPVALGARIDAEAVLGGIAAATLSGNVEGIKAPSITVDQTNGICFNNGDSVAIWLGQADDLPYKMALVERIYRLEPAIAERFASVDASVPQMPAGTPRATVRTRPSFDADAG